jgi:hypothetical protein
MFEQLIQLVGKRSVLTGGKIAGGQFFDRSDERLGDESTAVRSEVPTRIRIASSEHRSIGFYIDSHA